ncbi:protein asteroid-like [Diachasma alloeum]|uniref:protein asteroid-like n=1 Tax=Diachasma alloeum TaxID=454923 RepID=UPI0010FB6D12|nr:protein asteroid-like [Diachasma alloeum]
MGIRGLSTYINQNSHYFLEPYQLHDTDLVIDGVNVYCNVYRATDKQRGSFGGQYDIFAEALKTFFEALLLCNIRPIIILDSVDALSKDQYVRKFQDKLTNSISSDCTMQHLMKDVFLSVIDSLKLKCVQTIMEADETMVAVAKALDCPVLSQDGDFYIQGTKFIHWNTLLRTPRSTGEGHSKTHWLSCQMYSVQKFCRKFDNLYASLLPLGLTILGTKDGRGRLDADMMGSFVSHINASIHSAVRNFHQRKIEKTFRWLSKFSSLRAAVADLLYYVEARHRPTVREEIEKSIAALGFGSPLALRALELPEEVVLKILDENDRKTMALGGITATKAMESGKMQMSYEYSEQELVEMSPKWLIEDLLRAKVRELPFEMMMFSAAILKPTNEALAYPPTCIPSVPILKAMFSLVSSLRGNGENVLELYYARYNKVVMEEIKVEASTVDLRDMKELKLEERKRFLDEALGVEGVGVLDELPEEWRLYVATLVFWMRQQKALPEKIEAHALSVIMTMLVGVIDGEIGVVRSKEKFHEEFGERWRDILMQPKDDRRGMKDARLTEVMEMVTEEECIAAALFFIELFQEGQYIRNPSTVVIHTFTQFHGCLKSAILLNSILDFPYAQVPVHRVFNGLLFYKVFEVFSKKQDVDSFVAEKLDRSPTLVRIFGMLKGMVLTILNTKN